MITWTASNNSGFLNGTRSAKTIRAAVRDARRYINNELSGNGTAFFYNDCSDSPFRRDTKNMFTGYRWATKTGSVR